MHSARQTKKVAPKLASKRPSAQKTKKTSMRVQNKRKFASSAPTSDPRFSTINADVDRTRQTLSMPHPRLSKLDNGLIVASLPLDGGLTTIALTVKAGSRYEGAENNGTSNFVARALTKGTKKRTGAQIQGELADFGADFKVDVGREMTFITATVQNKFAKKTLELLADVFQNTAVTEQTVDADRIAILQEIEENAQNLPLSTDDRLHESAFRGATLSFNPTGQIKNIKKISKKDIDQYMSTHFTANGTILSAVGDGFKDGELATLADELFKELPNKPRNGIKPNPGVANFIGSDIRVRDDDMPRVHLSFGFSTAPAEDADHFALRLLGHMIGNHHAQRSATDQYAASELVSNCATLGWADSFQTFNHVYSDAGIFGISAVAAPNVLDRLGDQMIRTMVQHATNVPEQHLIEAKSKLKLEILEESQSPELTAKAIGRQFIHYKRHIHPQEWISRVDAVDEIAVQNVVKRFFLDQDLVVAAQGNVFELGDYAMLRKKSVVPWM
jgi:processing peptidase subunit beta